MDTRKLMAGALAMSLLLAAGPGAALAQDDATLSPEGVEWTLATLAGGDVPAEVEVTLFLSGGETVGDAGCNSYFGSYELDGDALTFPNPFGVTQKFCEGAPMEVEGAYLPLLQATATWSIDENGALSLADADGTVQLVYDEATVDITMTDVEALVSVLEQLQGEIDEASAQVAAVAAETAAIPVNKFDKRVNAVEKSVADLEAKTEGLNVEGMKKRISANEKAIADLQARVDTLEKTIDRFRERILALEESDKAQNKRIKALEEAVFVPTPE
jgi:heat shock protein HslJ